MRDILDQIETPYIDSQALLCFLGEYQKPRERIRRLVDNGDLIRIKNGFFLIRSKIQQRSNRIIPYEQVANLLYGPSYVSLRQEIEGRRATKGAQLCCAPLVASSYFRLLQAVGNNRKSGLQSKQPGFFFSRLD